jgi:seryl-tRNA synthetase
MIDLKAARAEPDRFRAALARRRADRDFNALLKIDQQWRELTERVDSLRAAQKRRTKNAPTSDQLQTLKLAKEELRRAEDDLSQTAAEREALLAQIPNLPDPSAAEGMAEEDAEVVRTWGDPPVFSFAPRDHLQLGSPRGWVDMARGARMAGSRFAYRFGDVALTELALYRFVIAHLVDKGFLPVLGPVLADEKAMYGTGFLPTEESNLYRLERDGLYLTGTSEVALAAIHMGEILEPTQLPARYVAFSTNFRREAGAAGRDTRGMFRVHQFDKVEMYVYCQPEESSDWHERLLSYEEEVVQSLGLPYRVMNIAAGDLGASAAKKYDIEAWFPAQQRYREITSCSNTTDYQARRLSIRSRRDGSTQTVHTLNGTGVTARSLVAIMENFQDEAGVVAVPEVLHSYGAPSTIGTPQLDIPDS